MINEYFGETTYKELKDINSNTSIHCPCCASNYIYPSSANNNSKLGYTCSSCGYYFEI